MVSVWAQADTYILGICCSCFSHNKKQRHTIPCHLSSLLLRANVDFRWIPWINWYSMMIHGITWHHYIVELYYNIYRQHVFSISNGCYFILLAMITTHTRLYDEFVFIEVPRDYSLMNWINFWVWIKFIEHGSPKVAIIRLLRLKGLIWNCIVSCSCNENDSLEAQNGLIGSRVVLFLLSPWKNSDI